MLKLEVMSYRTMEPWAYFFLLFFGCTSLGACSSEALLVGTTPEGEIENTQAEAEANLCQGIECPPPDELAQNRSPIIERISGPEALRSYQLREWEIVASDPDGEALSYVVEWGDGNVDEYDASADRPFKISHTYTRSGAHSIRVTASDGSLATDIETLLTEIPYTTLLFTDFYSPSTAQGLQEGDLLVARDEQGVLVGLADVNADGAFLIHATGDDPMTSDVDEGAHTGSPIRFFVDGMPCVLMSGNNLWSHLANREIALACP